MGQQRAATIGIDGTSALTQGGGIGRYTRELLHALAEVDQTNRYVLFSARPPAQSPVPDSLPTTANFSHRPARLDERWLYRLWYRLRLPLPVQWTTGRLDLFHSPDFVLPPVGGAIPTLLTVHDLSFVHFPDAYTPQLVAYLNRVVPWSVRRASHILADSAATKADLLALWAVPDDKVTVLYSGVTERFRPNRNPDRAAAVRARYGLGSEPFILSVGTVQPRKNYEMLIRAYAGLAADWHHNLVIAGGKGWLFDGIIGAVDDLGLRGRVHFTGFVDDDDLPVLYSEATLLAFPSLYEGFGLPLIEAMACGVPVVASNASSLPEVVGDAGVLLPPDNADVWRQTLHRLLLNGPRRAELVAAGAVRARQFNWRRAARQLQALYQTLLNQHEP